MIYFTAVSLANNSRFSFIVSFNDEVSLKLTSTILARASAVSEGQLYAKD